MFWRCGKSGSLVAVVVLLGVVWGWYRQSNPTVHSSTQISEPSVAPAISNPSERTGVSNSPFSIREPALTLSPDSIPGSAITQRDEKPVVGRDAVAVEAGRIMPVASFNMSGLDEIQWMELVKQLRAQPSVLPVWIDEFRQLPLGEQKSNLAKLLSEVGGPDVLQLASELVYSGDSKSSELGLELLQALQPNSAEAYEIATSLLLTESDTNALVNTLTTFAKVGTVDDISKSFLIEQITQLADHVDPGVRGMSYTILSRWSEELRHVPVLIEGLDDVEPVVRETVAHALINHQVQSPELIQSLVQISANENEVNSVRRAAILALRSLTISSSQRQDLDAYEQQLDTVTR